MTKLFFTTSIFLSLLPILILIAMLYKRYAILCIALITVFVAFTSSKLRIALVDTQILDKERYVKNIVATVKDISNKGSYRQFLLSVEKLPSVIPAPKYLDPEKIQKFQRHALATLL
ncbi:MAG: hypothetical protein ACR5KX_04360 [Wolbachia sp.]